MNLDYRGTLHNGKGHSETRDAIKFAHKHAPSKHSLLEDIN